MRPTVLLLIVLASLSRAAAQTPAAAEKPPERIPAISERVRGLSRQEGFLSYFWDERRGQLRSRRRSGWHGSLLGPQFPLRRDKLLIPRPIHLTHPARTERREDLVGAEAGAGVKCHEVLARILSFSIADLSVTTGFRDVFVEILEKLMGLSKLGPVLPGHALDEKKRLGVIA